MAGPAFTSPLRHSVPHWYGLIPRRVIAGAGPEVQNQEWVIQNLLAITIANIFDTDSYIIPLLLAPPCDI